VDCPLATLLFAACTAIGSAMTAAMMNDAPYVLASFCRFNRIGKLKPSGLRHRPAPNVVWSQAFI
jgi:hypothetical protein